MNILIIVLLTSLYIFMVWLNRYLVINYANFLNDSLFWLIFIFTPIANIIPMAIIYFAEIYKGGWIARHVKRFYGK